MAKEAIKKTLYFDIGTEAKIQKIKRKIKKGRKSDSRVVRRLIAMTPFEKIVEDLNDEIDAVDAK